MSSWQLICFLCGQGISTAIRIWLEDACVISAVGGTLEWTGY